MDNTKQKNTMLLSTATSSYLKHYTMEETINLLHESGFDAIDFSFFSREKFYSSDTDASFFENLKKHAQNRGMIFNQGHAPFPQPMTEEETDKLVCDIIQTIKNASLLGIKILVVHPLVFISDNPQELFDLNMKFFARLKPYCEEYNVKIALENMWQYKRCTGRSAIVHSVCSKPQEFIEYLDELNSDCFVACLDIGHACLVREDPADFITKLGKNRLKALHIHDVDGSSDLHTAPYYGGVADWDSIALALREIQYDGDFTFEAGSFLNFLPKQLVPHGTKLMAEIGKHIINLATN